VISMLNVSQPETVTSVFGTSPNGMLQSLNRKKTHHHAHSFPRSSPRYLTLDSLMTDATSFPATTLRSRSGMSIWSDNQ